MMKATERLYLTGDAKALVREGDPRGASLYAAPGDEIPESAVAMFGLVDGTVKPSKAAGGGTKPAGTKPAGRKPAGRKPAKAAKEAKVSESKEAPPAADKEAAPVENKEAVPVENKGAGPADGGGIAPVEGGEG